MHYPPTKAKPKQFGQQAFLAFCLLILATYPVYTNYQYAHGKDHVYRHLEFLNGTSKFYNPWQYRALAPLVTELMFQVADRTVFGLVPFQWLPAQYSEQYIKYNLVLIFHRAGLGLAVFYLMLLYYRKLGIDRVFIGFGAVFASFAMANGVYDSDLRFNVYYDVAFYLTAGMVLARGLPSYWFVPLSFLACLNRETSLFIPLMLLWRARDWSAWRLAPSPAFKGTLGWVLASLLAYAVAFGGVRYFYGYQPAFTDMWLGPGWRMFFRNLLHPVAHGEVLGVFMFLPFLGLFHFRRTALLLRFLFVLIVPVWFLVQYWLVFVHEAAIFLVPTLLVFLPMSLQIAAQYQHKSKQPMAMAAEA
jgi:hypothetical protein